ncbi:hypothetical protein QEO94_03380 [Kingella negevensis]|nr:hypothetical protein [Kingella negevensis]WII93856.1 hypothetical protein QEO94_03380 [Kingella negevensis]
MGGLYANRSLKLFRLQKIMGKFALLCCLSYRSLKNCFQAAFVYS